MLRGQVYCSEMNELPLRGESPQVHLCYNVLYRSSLLRLDQLFMSRQQNMVSFDKTSPAYEPCSGPMGH